MASEDYITVHSFRSLAEVDQAKMALDLNGIPYVTDGEYTIQTDWALSNATGGIRLKVPPEHAPAAREILARPVKPLTGAEKKRLAISKFITVFSIVAGLAGGGISYIFLKSPEKALGTAWAVFLFLIILFHIIAYPKKKDH
jgi:hypothetical protein